MTAADSAHPAPTATADSDPRAKNVRPALAPRSGYRRFVSSLALPQALEAGLAVARIGGTSVSYEIGIFAAGAAETAAHGRFIHVYVDRKRRRPVPLPIACSRS